MRYKEADVIDIDSILKMNKPTYKKAIETVKNIRNDDTRP